MQLWDYYISALLAFGPPSYDREYAKNFTDFCVETGLIFMPQFRGGGKLKEIEHVNHVITETANQGMALLKDFHWVYSNGRLDEYAKKK